MFGQYLIRLKPFSVEVSMQNLEIKMSLFIRNTKKTCYCDWFEALKVIPCLQSFRDNCWQKYGEEYVEKLWGHYLNHSTTGLKAIVICKLYCCVRKISLQAWLMLYTTTLLQSNESILKGITLWDSRSSKHYATKFLFLHKVLAEMKHTIVKASQMKDIEHRIIHISEWYVYLHQEREKLCFRENIGKRTYFQDPARMILLP